jgi:hypothetical protein
MKHIVKFNELNSSTYRSAASKLQKIGHNRRAKELSDWSVLKDRRDSINRWKRSGVFKLDLYINTKKIFTSDFYIAIELTESYFEDFCFDSLRNNFDCNDIIIPFELGIIPVDDLTVLEMKKYDIKEYNGVYWTNGLFINSETLLDTIEGSIFYPSDRREALNFKRLLVGMVSGENNWNEEYTADNIINKINNNIEKSHVPDNILKKPANITGSEIIDIFKKISLNELYIN